MHLMASSDTLLCQGFSDVSQVPSLQAASSQSPHPYEGAELVVRPQLAVIKAPLRCPRLLSVWDRVFLDHACLSSRRTQWAGPGACGWHCLGSRSESQPHDCVSFVALLTVKCGQGLSCSPLCGRLGEGLSLEAGGAMSVCIGISRLEVPGLGSWANLCAEDSSDVLLL